MSYRQPFIEKKPHPVGSVRHYFNFFNFEIYFNLRAEREFWHASRLAGVLLCHQFFFSTVRDGLARARAPWPRAAQLSLCTPENLVSRDDSGSTLSVPH